MSTKQAQTTDLAELYGNSDSTELEYSYGGEKSPFPTIYWRYGNKQMSVKTTGASEINGGFFIPDDGIPTRSDFDREAFAEALLANGWTRDSFIPQGDGDGEGEETTVEGWYKEYLFWNQVNHRKTCFGVKQDGKSVTGRRVTGSFDSVANIVGRENVRTMYQAMVSIPGLSEDFGPFVFSTKVSSAIAYEGNREEPGVIRWYLDNVVKPVDQAICAKFKLPLGRKVPLYEFCLPVGIQRDAKGAVIFSKKGEGAKSRFIALPALIDVRPGQSVDEIRKNLMITDDKRAALAEMFEKSKEWAAAWKEDKAAQANGNGNAKQAQTFANVEGM